MNSAVVLDSDSEPEDDLQITGISNVQQSDDLQIVGSNSVIDSSFQNSEDVELVDEVIFNNENINDDIEITGQNIINNSNNDDEIEVIRVETLPQNNVIYLPGNRTLRFSGPRPPVASSNTNDTISRQVPNTFNNTRFQQYQTGQRRVLRGASRLNSRQSRYNSIRSSPRFIQRLSRRIYESGSSNNSDSFIHNMRQSRGDPNLHMDPGQSIREIYVFVSDHANDILDSSNFEAREDEIPYTVLQQIDRDNNAIMSRKIQEHKNFSKPYVERANKRVEDLPENYTTDLHSLEDNAVVVCLLCGISLGEGISDEFKSLFDVEREKKLANPNHEKIDYDDAKIFEKQVEFYNCPAPYQLVSNLTESDKLSSKKVFFSRCGHVYCGRCVQNIVNRRKTVKNSKKNMQNPLVYGPKRCVADKCNKGLKSFIELFN